MGLNGRWAAARAFCTAGAIIASAVAITAGSLALAPSVAAAPARTTTTTSTTTPATTTPAPPAWQTAWTSTMDFTLPSVVASNLTVRDIAQVAVAGTSVQLQLSNTWSNAPTTFGSVTVGVAQSGATIVPGSIVPVTFGGSRSVTIPASGTVTSDPVAMTVQAGQSLAVSLSVEGSATVSVHYCCKGHIDSYATVNGGGDQTTNPAASSFVFADENMRWLSAIAVAGTAAQGTVVAFGDSITEGDFNAGFGWPNALQARISQLPASQQVALANQSISGNTLTVFPPGASYAAASGGLPGVTRLAPDALSLPGVKTIVLFLGTNDIWFGAGGEDTSRPIPPYGSAPVIEAAMAAVIAATHAAGIKIFGVTLLPRSSFAGGNDEKPELWSPSDQATLAAVNAWILTPGNGFDGTINLAAVMGDVYNGACKPDTPFAPYFTVDNLHPNTAGQTVMADAIPTPLFSIPEAPQVPQPVAVTPTPGCPGAAAAEQVLALGRAPAPPTPPTTPPPTPTTQPVPKTVSHRGSGHTATVVLAAVGAAIVLIIAALLVILRRRAIRRRRQRSPNRRVGLLGSGAHSPGAGHPPTTPESDGVLNRGEGEHALTLPIRMQARGTDIEGSAPHSG